MIDLRIPRDAERISRWHTPQTYRSIVEFFEALDPEHKRVARLAGIHAPRISLFLKGVDSMKREKAVRLVAVLRFLARQRLRRLEAAVGNHKKQAAGSSSTDVDVSAA